MNKCVCTITHAIDTRLYLSPFRSLEKKRPGNEAKEIHTITIKAVLIVVSTYTC